MRRMVMWSVVVVSLMVASRGLGVTNSSAEMKSVKEVMKAGHTGDSSLLKKVLGGQASEDEKKMLVDLYIDLVENAAPKGDEIEWKMMAGRAFLAATKVYVGREDAIDELKDATNCKACHDKFKGK